MRLIDIIILSIIAIFVIIAFVIMNVIHNNKKKKKLSSSDINAQKEELKKQLAELEEKQALAKKVSDDAEYGARAKAITKEAKKAYKKGGSELVIKEVVLKDAIADSTYCIKRFISPDGINTVPLKYVTTEEGGNTTYHAVLYVEEMPKKAVFVETFSPLFNYPDAVASVNILPYGAAKSRKLLNKRIISLGSEQIEARKSGDPNRIREIDMKYADAEGWAKVVEEGQTALYKVAIYLKIVAHSAEELIRRCSDVYNIAKENGMEMGSCFAGQAEAMISSAPLNKVVNPNVGGLKGKLIRANGMKYHVMDKYSLCTIYNHTQSSFSHKDGVCLGRNLGSGKPIIWDPYNKNHNGFSVCVAGQIGAGKSATVKIISSRYSDFDDCKVVVVDLDTPDSSQGEYASEIKQLGGKVFSFTSDSTNRLNLFDINVSVEWDSNKRLEYKDLRLDEKINDLHNILMCMIKDGRDIGNYNIESYIRKILSTALRKLYANLGLVNREPSSLYVLGEKFENGVLTTGQVKKTMPTLSDFYILLYKMSKENTDPFFEESYHLILSNISEWVDNLVFGTKSYRRFTYDEYLEMGFDDDANIVTEFEGGVEIVEYVHGIRPYFDGYSNLDYDIESVRALDLDISLLPESDKLIAQEICCNYVNENFIKRNSANPQKLNKLLFIIDEFHRMLGTGENLENDASRRFVADLYRVSRKKNVSMWTITQSVADYDTCDQGRAIFKNAACKFILRQDSFDSDVLKRATPLTDAQIGRVLSLGSSSKVENELDSNYTASNEHKGEVCLIDNNNVVFLKVDYLRRVESAIVETDARNRQALFKKGMI